MRSATDILVLGVGNLLCSDDGVGAEVIRQLQEDPPPGAVLADVGTAILHAVGFIETARRVLVIDAVKAGGTPGTIYELEIFETTGRDWRSSMHALGLREALRVLSPGLVPPPIHVIGVEPLVLEYGIGLSAPVAAAVPEVLTLVRHLVADWQDEVPAPGAVETADQAMFQRVCL